MPKYKVEVSFENQTVEINTDDYKEEMKTDGVDENDPEMMEEWIRDWVEDDRDAFNIYPNLDKVEVTKIEPK